LELGKKVGLLIIWVELSFQGKEGWLGKEGIGGIRVLRNCGGLGYYFPGQPLVNFRRRKEIWRRLGKVGVQNFSWGKTF